MRLIDANELYRVKFHGYPDIEITPSDVNAEAYKRGWNDAIDAVAECGPFVEIVRCKDCKWFESAGIAEYGNCFNLEIRSGVNDYCSFAERRTDGSN